MRLLLVEDNDALRHRLAEALSRAGFEVDPACCAREAEEYSDLAEHDLVLLDLGLPDRDGLQLLSRWRRSRGTPLIVSTARDDVEDRVAGLEAGADDYVLKPVATSELVARIRAVLRRPGGRLGVVLTAGDLRFDTNTRQARLGGRTLALSRREAGVLEQLMRNLGSVVRRGRLEDAAYALGREVGPNAIEAAISRLRRALEAAGAAPQIVTVRGVGWMMADPEERR